MSRNDLASLITRHAQHRPYALALQSDGWGLNWRELQAKIQVYARQLSEQGVGVDDRVIVVGRNEWEVLHLYLSCLWLGAVCIVVNRFPKPELIRIAEQVGATHRSLLNEELSAVTLPCVKHFIDNPLRQVEIKPASCRIASVVLSSGSTGTPKAFVHTSQAHLDSAKGVCELMRWHSDDNCHLSLPLYHVSGLGLVWRWLNTGSCLSIGRQLNQWRHPVTITSMVSTQLQRYLANPYSKTLKVLLGGSYIDPTLVDKASARGVTCYVGYAMTEMASTICAKRYDGNTGVGEVLYNRELSLIGKEIAVKGSMLALGTLDKGQLLPLITDNGWYHTKDLGSYADGQWYIHGRKDNAFVSGGENIHCEEVERALLSTGDFEQVMVLPVPDPEFGFRPVALYAASQGFSQTDTEMKLADCLIKFKWPVAYHVIPPAFLGEVKLNRKRLEQWLADTHSSLSDCT